MAAGAGRRLNKKAHLFLIMTNREIIGGMWIPE
jgi:hypothetical protein